MKTLHKIFPRLLVLLAISGSWFSGMAEEIPERVYFEETVVEGSLVDLLPYLSETYVQDLASIAIEYKSPYGSWLYDSLPFNQDSTTCYMPAFSESTIRAYDADANNIAIWQFNTLRKKYFEQEVIGETTVNLLEDLETVYKENISMFITKRITSEDNVEYDSVYLDNKADVFEVTINSDVYVKAYTQYGSVIASWDFDFIQLSVDPVSLEKTVSVGDSINLYDDLSRSHIYYLKSFTISQTGDGTFDYDNGIFYPGPINVSQSVNNAYINGYAEDSTIIASWHFSIDGEPINQPLYLSGDVKINDEIELNSLVPEYVTGEVVYTPVSGMVYELDVETSHFKAWEEGTYTINAVAKPENMKIIFTIKVIDDQPGGFEVFYDTTVLENTWVNLFDVIRADEINTPIDSISFRLKPNQNAELGTSTGQFKARSTGTYTVYSYINQDQPYAEITLKALECDGCGVPTYSYYYETATNVGEYADLSLVMPKSPGDYKYFFIGEDDGYFLDELKGTFITKHVGVFKVAVSSDSLGQNYAEITIKVNDPVSDTVYMNLHAGDTIDLRSYVPHQDYSFLSPSSIIKPVENGVFVGHDYGSVRIIATSNLDVEGEKFFIFEVYEEKDVVERFDTLYTDAIADLRPYLESGVTGEAKILTRNMVEEIEFGVYYLHPHTTEFRFECFYSDLPIEQTITVFLNTTDDGKPVVQFDSVYLEVADIADLSGYVSDSISWYFNKETLEYAGDNKFIILGFEYAKAVSVDPAQEKVTLFTLKGEKKQDSTQSEVQTYEVILFEGDKLDLFKFAPVRTPVKYNTDSGIIRIVGRKAYALEEGDAAITITKEEDGKELAVVNVTVIHRGIQPEDLILVSDPKEFDNIVLDDSVIFVPEIIDVKVVGKKKVKVELSCAVVLDEGFKEYVYLKLIYKAKLKSEVYTEKIVKVSAAALEDGNVLVLDLEEEIGDAVGLELVVLDGATAKDGGVAIGSVPMNGTISLALSSDEVSETVAAYPNPFTSVLVLQGSGTATITNMTGTAVLSVQLSDGNTTVDTQALPAGMYVITFSNGGEPITVQK